MREKERIKRILDKLKIVWEAMEDQRLGQLFENYLIEGKGRGDKTSMELYRTEDTEYEERLDNIIKQIKDKKT